MTSYFLEYEDFRSIVSKLYKIQSTNGVSYSNIRVVNEYVCYQRDNAQSPDKIEKIELEKLLKFYRNGIFTTTAAKETRFGLGGKQSPAVAIVKAVKAHMSRNNNDTSNIQTITGNDSFSHIRKTKEYKETKESMKHNFSGNIKEIESLLMNEKKFVKVSKLTANDIPNKPGFYVIRINDINVLPEVFSKALEQRKHNILYIGISKDNIQDRLWNQELHLKKPATFFRSMGAILGYRPPKNTLSSKSYNYKFSQKDTDNIIQWMKENLLVNYIACDYNEKILKCIEKELIKQYKPIINIQNNPYKLKELEELRDICVEIARSKESVKS